MSPRRYPVIGARVLVARLRRAFGYEIVRQKGSHIRLTTLEGGEHSITIPNHDPIQKGTLSGIVADVAGHFGLTTDAVLDELGRRHR